MTQHDDGPTTRDIASGGATSDPARTEDEARFEREAETGDTAAEPAHEPATGTLMPDTDQQTFVARWQDIQARFVDDPRSAVEDADQLVASVMQRLADGFAEERERLEAMWGRGEDVGTEDLRVALQRYRAFFQRLLST